MSAGTQLAHFFNLLEKVKKQPAIYQLTDNIEAAIAAVKPQKIRGIVSSVVFCDYVEPLLMEKPRDGGFAGVLIALRPVPMLSAEMVLSQINLTRMGDVACAADNVVYLFLFGCRPSFAMFALQRVFKLPFSELIIENQIYDELSSIEEQVLRIRKSQTSTPSGLSLKKFLSVEDKTEAKPLFQPVLKPLNS